MTTAYTSLLGLALPVTGELSGTWGDTVNNSITSLLDSAIAGTQTLTADTTLTTTTGAANESRQAILLCSPASANITITAPAQSKIYTVINTSGTYTVKIRGVGPTTGVTLAVSESAVVAWNGTDFIRISSSNSTTGNFTVNGNLVVTGNTTIGDADTDTITQAASYVTGTQLKSAKTATNTLSLAAYDTDGAAYTNLITLTASTTPTLALTSTGVGTINNMSIGATTASTGAFTTLTSNGATTFTAGTASTTTGTGTLVITGGLGVSGRINAANFDGIVGANTAAAGAFTTLSATGVTTVQAGSAASPAITTSGDTNTGIFFPAADTIAFAEGGAESMRIDASGRLLVGTTADQTGAKIQSQLVSVSRTTSLVPMISASSGGSNCGLLLTTNSTGVRTAIVFENNNGAATVGSISTSGSATSYNTSTTSGLIGAGADIVAINTASTERMRIDSSGDVGIGTTSPQNVLHVSAADATLRLTTTSDTGEAGIELWDNQNGTSQVAAIRYNDTDNLFTIQANANGTIFLTPSNTFPSASEAMRIDSAGDLGIGTTSPSRKLHVVGNNAVAFLADSGTDNTIATFQSSNAQANLDITGSGARFRIGASGTGEFFLSTGTTSTYTERMRIDSSGNVGIGTSSPAVKLDVAGSINLTGNVIVASGQGIDFSATAGTGTSELLNDYEEGTWTPVYSTGTTPPTTPFTMDVVSATYTKVGRMVNIRAVIRTDSVDTTGAAGSLIIQGLPFTSAASSAGQTPVLVARVDTWAGDYPDCGYVEGGNTIINLQYRTSVNGATFFMNAADLTTGAVSNANNMQLSSTYYV